MTSPAHPVFDHQVFDLSVIFSAVGYVQRRMATPLGGFQRALSPSCR